MALEPRMLIAVDLGELQQLRQDVLTLSRLIESVKLTPISRWQSVSDYALHVGRSEKTIRNWVRDGKLSSRREGTVLMIEAA